MRRARIAAWLTALMALSGAVHADEFPVIAGLEAQRSVWMGTCVGCHGDGLAGAPPVLDRQAWAPRLAKGRDTLLRHALKGFFGPDGSMMPPRGGNDQLSDAEVAMALDYMLAVAGGQP